MKKLSLILIAAVLISLCGCHATPDTPGEVTDPIPESEIAGYTLTRPIVCGNFPTRLDDIENQSDIIVIATPLESFSESETKLEGSLGNTIRKCRVDKVIKGSELSEITLYEPLYISEDRAVSVNYNSNPMLKDYQYLIFGYDSNTEGIYCTHNVFALETAVNEKFPVSNQQTYSEVLDKYKEYFDCSF